MSEIIMFLDLNGIQLKGKESKQEEQCAEYESSTLVQVSPRARPRARVSLFRIHPLPPLRQSKRFRFNWLDLDPEYLRLLNKMGGLPFLGYLEEKGSVIEDLLTDLGMSPARLIAETRIPDMMRHRHHGQVRQQGNG